MIEEGGKALAAYIRPREEGALRRRACRRSHRRRARRSARCSNTGWPIPQRAVELQSRLGKSYLDLWAARSKRMAGEETAPVIEPDPKDKRFSDPEWTENQFFDFLKQAYLLTTEWADHLVNDAEGLDPHTRHKAEFYINQIANALSPSNFVMTNPEVLRETLASNAENLVRGMHNLAEDIKAGGGDLRIRQSDRDFSRSAAISRRRPARSIFQNDLIQLIQYAPTTEKVLGVRC